jgi:hypothetical protein
MERGTGLGIKADGCTKGGSVTEPSTRPTNVKGPHDAIGPWQEEGFESSFSPARQTIVGPELSPASQVLPDAANQGHSSTVSDQEVVRPPESQPLIVEHRDYGKRAFHSQYVWEGVVEHVDKSRTTFECRIVPLMPEGTDPAKVELTEFSFDDLANESDRSLVVPGAVFYWTVGRSRNRAGTVANLSLLRFRRLPPPTPVRMSLAEQEANDLLRTLGDGDGSTSAGG